MLFLACVAGTTDTHPGIRGSHRKHLMRTVSPLVPFSSCSFSGYSGWYPCGTSPTVPFPGIRGGTLAVPPQLFLFRVSGGGTDADPRSAGTSPPQLQVGSSQYPTASVAPRRWVRGVSGGPFGSVRPEVIAFWVFRASGIATNFSS